MINANKPWGNLFITAFMLASVSAFATIVLGKFAPEEDKNPAALLKSGFHPFFHLVHVQSTAIISSFMYTMFIVFSSFAVMKSTAT